MLREELEYDQITEVLCTNSHLVLGYIGNDSRRFHVFFANRVQQIRESSSPEQWRHVKRNENPADDAPCGLTVHDLSIIQDGLWVFFLWEQDVSSKADDEMNPYLVVSPYPRTIRKSERPKPSPLRLKKEDVQPFQTSTASRTCIEPRRLLQSVRD